MRGWEEGVDRQREGKAEGWGGQVGSLVGCEGGDACALASVCSWSDAAGVGFGALLLTTAAS